MKIKLVRSGGFLPVTKMSETEADLSNQELDHLLNVIQTAPAAPRIKDGTSYQLIVGDVEIPVNLEAIPKEHASLFDKLKSELRIVKR